MCYLINHKSDTNYFSLAQSDHQNRRPKYKLENDNVCGITTGDGKENCEWDCISSLGTFYQNPECLIDCFEAEHCAVKAINDYIEAGGICRGSINGNIDQNVWPTSTKRCEYQTVFFNDTNDDVNDDYSLTFTSRGIFKEETLKSLTNNQTCIYDVHRKSPFVYNTISFLVLTSSSLEVYQYWYYFSAKFIAGLAEEVLSLVLPLPFTSTRLHPGFR